MAAVKGVTEVERVEAGRLLRTANWVNVRMVMWLEALARTLHFGDRVLRVMVNTGLRLGEW